MATAVVIQRRWVWSISIRSPARRLRWNAWRPLIAGRLQIRKERQRLNAVRRIMRARVDTARLGVLDAQIAAGGLALRDLQLAGRLCRIGHGGLEGVQRQVAVRAIVGAEAAADAPVLDDDLERVATPNRSDRTADHAERIAALPAGRGDEIFVEAQAFTYQPRHAVVRIGASAHALIATRALFQIEQ